MNEKDKLLDIFPILNLPPESYAQIIKLHREFSKKNKKF